MAFGFGRRICPGTLLQPARTACGVLTIPSGLNLAEATVFTFVSQILACFDIKKVVKNGKEITPEAAFDSGVARYAPSPPISLYRITDLLSAPATPCPSSSTSRPAPRRPSRSSSPKRPEKWRWYPGPLRQSLSRFKPPLHLDTGQRYQFWSRAI